MGNSKSELATFSSQAMFPVVGFYYIWLICQPKNLHSDLQTTQAEATTDLALWQLTVEPQLQETTSSQLIKHREVELVGAWSPHPYIPISSEKEGTLKALKSEAWIPTQPQNPHLQSVLPVRCAGNGGQELVGVQANENLV